MPLASTDRPLPRNILVAGYQSNHRYDIAINHTRLASPDSVHDCAGYSRDGLISIREAFLYSSSSFASSPAARRSVSGTHPAVLYTLNQILTTWLNKPRCVLSKMSDDSVTK